MAAGGETMGRHNQVKPGWQIERSIFSHERTDHTILLQIDLIMCGKPNGINLAFWDALYPTKKWWLRELQGTNRQQWIWTKPESFVISDTVNTDLKHIIFITFEIEIHDQDTYKQNDCSTLVHYHDQFSVGSPQRIPNIHGSFSIPPIPGCLASGVIKRRIPKWI
jgi:hypothetical protein